MKQTVNVTVSGLTLFVPDHEQMLVLLPATHCCGDPRVPPHRPVLRYPAETVESGSAGGLDLTGLGLRFGLSGGLDTSFPVGVPDLRRYTGVGVPERNLHGDGAGAVAARLSLPAGRLRMSGTPSKWMMRRADGGGDEQVTLTNEVVWTATIEDGDPPLTLYGGSVGSGESEPLVTFRRDVPTLWISLSHDVEEQDYAMPAVGSENDHYQAYRWLLDDDAQWSLPRFVGVGSEGGGVFAHGLRVLTCIIGGTTNPPPDADECGTGSEGGSPEMVGAPWNPPEPLASPLG